MLNNYIFVNIHILKTFKFVLLQNHVFHWSLSISYSTIFSLYINEYKKWIKSDCRIIFTNSVYIFSNLIQCRKIASPIILLAFFNIGKLEKKSVVNGGRKGDRRIFIRAQPMQQQLLSPFNFEPIKRHFPPLLTYFPSIT